MEKIPRAHKQGGRHLVYIGVPTIGFMFGALYLMTTFQETTVELRDKQASSMSVRQFNLEEERKKLENKLNIDNFKLSRIPRPGEATLPDEKKRIILKTTEEADAEIAELGLNTEKEQDTFEEARELRMKIEQMLREKEDKLHRQKE